MDLFHGRDLPQASDCLQSMDQDIQRRRLHLLVVRYSVILTANIFGLLLDSDPSLIRDLFLAMERHLDPVMETAPPSSLPKDLSILLTQSRTQLLNSSSSHNTTHSNNVRVQDLPPR